MASFLFLFLWVAAVITIFVVIKATVNYTRKDPLFALKAFGAAFASAAFGYIFKGHVEVKLALWGGGGALLYALYWLAKADA